MYGWQGKILVIDLTNELPTLHGEPFHASL
jgi:hypothetical protein